MMTKYDYIYFRYVNRVLCRLGIKENKNFWTKDRETYRETLNKSEVNLKISQAIIENVPFMAGRYGSTEMLAICGYLDKKFGLKRKIPQKTLDQMEQWSGFFPNNEKYVARFAEFMCDISKEVDILGIWNQMDSYMVKKYALKASVTNLAFLEPWYYCENPWSSSLKGKKVLVVHPFEETIKRQYERFDHIFPGTTILPQFDLYTLKAVQTIAGIKDKRFNTWFDALDWMYGEAMKIGFDVAILGCGAYGFPLAAMLRQKGKTAIHLGGATQLLFGIKGARWDNHPVISGFYNDFWVRPQETEKPKEVSIVENSCYW